MISRLRSLIAQEREVADRFYAGFMEKNPGGLLDTSFQRKLTLAKEVFHFQKAGTPLRYGHWGSVSVPQILCIQPSVIVDVPAVDDIAFMRQTGLSVEQFVELCEEGFILPNVYEDRLLQEDYDRSRLGDTPYANFDYLAPILQTDQIRINGIRRAALFECFGTSLAGESLDLDPLAAKMTPEIEKLGSIEDVNKLATGAEASTYRGVADKIAANLAYVFSLGTDYDRKMVLRIHESDPSYFGRLWSIPVLIQWARGRKTALASPITAAFGGACNNKEDEESLAEQ